MFLFGGNDANNMIVPIDSRYAAYQTMRGPVALAQASAAAGRQRAASAFHPALANVQRLYDQSQVATVFNVGTLVQPTTRDTLNSIVAAAQPLLALGPDAAVAELRSERRRHGLGRPHQRRHRRR